MRKIVVALFVLFVSFPVYSKLLKKSIPDKLIVLTFDDATASHYSVVAPLLKSYGFGATFFICEFGKNFQDSSKYMNWRQIQELDKMGFEVANHTRSHPGVSKLSREQVVSQLKYIEDKCDSLRIKSPSTFAYPGYDLSLPVIDILSERGYQFARAGGSRAYDPLTDHPLLIPSWAMTSGNKQHIMESFNEARDGKIVVLTIHGVPDIEHSWVNTPPELFREYLQYLNDHHFKVIALRDLGKYIDVKEAMKKINPDLSRKLKN
jgi:peptidoglycan/xylan/chitin deacetylase (PgdA/CDA1 family)